MKLLTKELREKLLAAGGSGETVICKLFNPAGAGTWLLTGMDADGDTLWAVCDLGMDCVEFGTVSLSELERMKGPFGLGIERDKFFKGGKPIGEYLKRNSLAGVN